MTTTLDLDYATTGALMLAPQLLEQVRPWLRPDDFAQPVCGRVYAMLLDMHDRDLTIDPITVMAELQRTGQQRRDGWPAMELIAMIEAVPTPAAGVHYARLVLEAALFRVVQQTGQRLIQIGQQRHGDVRDALSSAREQAAQLEVARQRWRTAHEPSTRSPVDLPCAGREQPGVDRSRLAVRPESASRAIAR